jgi:hypothetical protein
MANDLLLLLRLAEQTGDDAILDELVHETAQELGLSDLNEIGGLSKQEEHLAAVEAQASEINNGGFERQIEYLLQASVAKQTVEEAIRTSHTDQLK